MKLFACPVCGHAVHFDSHACVRCSSRLGLTPDPLAMAILDSSDRADAASRRWQQCEHRALTNGCNWLVAIDDETPFCVSCRLNRTIPDLSLASNRTLWLRLKQEKRRLVYSALRLGLPVAPKSARADGLAFDFLADPDPSFNDRERVLTGHADGLITLNIAEADDPVARERMRAAPAQPDRTVLGHFRHESGHYYWDRLVRDRGWLGPVRARFGDERADYPQALERHYRCGPPADWRAGYISAYAAAHPWEDWAETWSHYLHMVDTLETAWAYGLSIDPRLAGSEALAAGPGFDPYRPSDCAALIGQWMALTVALNSLNRSMGHEPSYPFALSAPVIDKLALIHRVVHETASPA